MCSKPTLHSPSPPLTLAVEDDALIVVAQHGELMDRVVTIIDQARTNVLRAVNSNMVIAYWLIGREIVQALQGGEERADYGSRLLADLSESLKRRYGRGFSATNLKYFRLFFQTYANRSPEIRHEPRDELSDLDQASVLADISAALEAAEALKCFVLFDLKAGDLTHQDIGQMDMYVRMVDDLKRAPDDNPTVGITLCAGKKYLCSALFRPERQRTTLCQQIQTGATVRRRTQGRAGKRTAMASRTKRSEG